VKKNHTASLEAKAVNVGVTFAKSKVPARSISRRLLRV
jgi:hypothetical protein